MEGQSDDHRVRRRDNLNLNGAVILSITLWLIFFCLHQFNRYYFDELQNVKWSFTQRKSSLA